MKIDISWKRVCYFACYISLIFTLWAMPNWDKATFNLVFAIFFLIQAWHYEDKE